MALLLLFAFLAGIFTVLSPCILPVLPILLSIGTEKGKWRPFGIVLGLVLSFTFFTLALTAIVHATGLSANVLRYVAIALIFLFGLIMIFPPLSNAFARLTAPIANLGQRIQETGPKQGFLGGLILGLALGLVWTPCAGPILAAMTTLVATQSINLTTILITLTYSIGAAIPMFLIAYGGSKIIQSSKFLSQHSERIRQVFGCLMILTAIAIAFHWDMLLQQQITRFFPTIMIEDNRLVKDELRKLRSHQKGILSNVVPDQWSNYGQAPELVGIVNWIQSPPLSLMQLQGKVVLIDFWTYSCINCVRTLPYLTNWYAKYKDKGLVIIGVHTPEFEFEKEAKNVANAAMRLQVKYPIARDNNYETWNAYQNLYWPAHYLIDQEGNLRLVHFGEGAYLETENGIRQLLGLPPLTMEEAPMSQRPISPETYLGFSRAKQYTPEIHIQENQIVNYSYRGTLMNDQVGLKGTWKIEREKITSEGDESYIEYNFLAKQVFLVLSGSSKTPLEIYLDGKLIGKQMIDQDRMYQLVDTSYGRHQLSLKIPKGISAYAFTFGDQTNMP